MEIMRNQANATQNSTARIVPLSYWRIAKFEILERFRLFVQFIDGTKGVVNMFSLIHGKNSGVFSVLQNETFFNQAFLEKGVITWPGELDLAPDAMYEEIKKNGEWVLS